MSDIEIDMPSEAAISQKLRDIVIALHKTGNSDELTVKRVRTRAETELSLPAGFLKTNAEWKEKSQSTIVDAVVGLRVKRGIRLALTAMAEQVLQRRACLRARTCADQESSKSQACQQEA